MKVKIEDLWAVIGSDGSMYPKIYTDKAEAQAMLDNPEMFNGKGKLQLCFINQE